jgi:hypothetical protein
MLVIAAAFCGIWGLVSKNYPVLQEKVSDKKNIGSFSLVMLYKQELN